jgi:hypothetical protein
MTVQRGPLKTYQSPPTVGGASIFGVNFAALCRYLNERAPVTAIVARTTIDPSYRSYLWGCFTAAATIDN